MKKTLKLMLVMVLSIALLMPLASAALDGFHDAPAEDNWKYYGLNCAVRDEVMKGHNGALRPDDQITRAELTTMMVRFLGSEDIRADVDHYIDLVANAWYYDYIRSGVATKIINGSGNKMMPNDPVTREQAIAILARTFVLLPKNENSLNSFSDAAKVSSWAKKDTSALIERKVVLGGAKNDIRPKDNVTRAEFAAMLYRIVFIYDKAGASYAGQTIEGSLALTDANIDLTGATIEGDLYIVESVGDATVNLKDVTVKGDIIVRSGNVVIEGDSSASKIIYGNATGSASVTGKDGVSVDEIIITENAKDVDNGISADKVEINADDADIDFTGDAEYGDVTINGDNADVNVGEGSTIDKVTANGENTGVSGNGTVNDAVINGEGSTITTPSTNVTDNTQKPDDGDDDGKDDDKDDDKTTQGGSSVGGGGGSSGGGSSDSGAPTNATYISWYDSADSAKTMKYVLATVNGTNVTFDLSNLPVASNKVVLRNLFVYNSQTVTGTVKGFAGATITTNTEKLLETLLVEMLNSTTKQVSEMIGITNASGNVVKASTLANLATVANDAYLFYSNDMSSDKWMQKLFDNRYITVADGQFSFVGKINGTEYTIKFLLP